MSVNTVKLEDVCNITTGKYDANHGENGGMYPFYTCAIEPIKCPTYSFEGESIILPGNGANVGEVLYCKDKFEAYQRTYVLNNIQVNPRFVYYQLKSRWKKYVSNKQYGSATNYIRYNNIAEFKIPLISLEQQRKIVDILDKADEIRTKKKLANVKLDEFLKSTFIDMFGDPNLNNKGLSMVAIKELCDTQTGSTPKRDNINYYNSYDVPWVKTGEVVNNYIFGASEFITHLAIKETNCKLFPINTILVAMYGQGLTRGRVGMLKIPASTNQACCAILPSDKIDEEFLFNQLKLQYKALRDYGRGGNQPNLNMDIVRNFKVIVPNIKEQHEFVCIVKKVEEQKQKNEKIIEQMNNLFNSLSQKAFNDK